MFPINASRAKLLEVKFVCEHEAFDSGVDVELGLEGLLAPVDEPQHLVAWSPQ